MRALAALALLVAGAASAKTDPQADAAFRAAFGKSGSAILKRQGQYRESVKYTPGGLVEAPFGPVLISPGEVLDASHASAGKLAAIYLKRTPRGFAVIKRFVPATETGSHGTNPDWRASSAFGPLPVVIVEGGGTFQGCTTSVATLLELAPQGPRELVTVTISSDNSGAVAEGHRATSLTGRIARIVPNRSFEVVYFGTKRFTERYVRRGDRYVLAGGGESRVEGC